MKRMTTKLTALLLVLILTLSAVPFAAAAHTAECQLEVDINDDGICDFCRGTIEDQAEPPAVCEHENTETVYSPNNNGSHKVKVICAADNCGKLLDENVENCADGNGDGDCDKCYADVEVEDACPHENTTTTYEAKNNGTHMVKVVCNDPECGVTVSETAADCADDDENGVCDVCQAAMVEKEEQKAFITCPQDGTETTASSKAMSFSLGGVDTDQVTWSFTVSGSADAELTSIEQNGKSATVTVRSSTGQGLAKVTATAKWADGEVSASFHVAFYLRKDWVVYVKEGKKSLRFTDTNVFSKVSGVYSDKVDKYSLYRLLTDGRATRVILSEDSRGNEDVGLISYKTTGKFYQYDPDDYNDYAIRDLENLIFTVVGEGTYKLSYELYEMSGSKGFTTTRGSLSIVSGDPADFEVDITYRTNGGNVIFDESDFVEYWEDNADDHTEKLKYVKFDVDDLDYGGLYLDKTTRGVVKASYKFCPDYTKSSTGMYDLNTVTYVPDPREDRYTEELGFVAYGNRDGVVRGTVTLVLGEEVPFTDVRESDWFYDEVGFVFANNIMNGVSDSKFDPNGTLTRGMVVTMLYRMAGEPNAYDTGAFSDVREGQWYADAVAWAAHNDIVEGMGNGKFAPNAAITREQLATILYRYAKHDRMDVSFGSTDLEDFRDDNKVSAWAESAMKWAVYAKIMEGSNNYLNPKNTATRAEAAAMFQRFMKQ